MSQRVNFVCESSGETVGADKYWITKDIRSMTGCLPAGAREGARAEIPRDARRWASQNKEWKRLRGAGVGRGAGWRLSIMQTVRIAVYDPYLASLTCFISLLS